MSLQRILSINTKNYQAYKKNHSAATSTFNLKKRKEINIIILLIFGLIIDPLLPHNKNQTT